MKKFILFLLIVGGLIYYRQTHGWDLEFLGIHNGSSVGASPAVISNPTYAVIRFRTQFHDRTIDSVLYGKTFDDADCKHASDDLVQRVLNPEHSNGLITWTLVESQCQKELEPRITRLFENIPTFANYISAMPGAGNEREYRLIFWGLTAAEGDAICGEIPRLQQRWQGTLTCIHGQMPQ